MQLCVLDCDYHVLDGKPVIRLFGVTREGKSCVAFVHGFKPYFYALAKDFEKAKKDIEAIGGVASTEEESKSLHGITKNLIKVFCFLPSDVPQVREEVRHLDSVDEIFEYDILFGRRFLIDNGLFPLSWLDIQGSEIVTKGFDVSIKTEKIKKIDSHEVKPKTLAFDIETFEEEGHNKVIMLSVFTEGYKKLLTYKKTSSRDCEILKDEKELLKRFLELVREVDPDIIVTYNGDGFDFQVIRERAEKLKVPFTLGRDGSRVAFDKRARESSARIIGRVHIDLYRFVSVVLASQMQSESLSLDAVANELLGEKKMGMKYDDIREAWNKGSIDKLSEYCLHDSYLTFSLATLLLQQVFEISKLVGQPPYDTSRMTYGQLVEWFLMRKAYPSILVPNKIGRASGRDRVGR